VRASTAQIRLLNTEITRAVLAGKAGTIITPGGACP